MTVPFQYTPLKPGEIRLLHHSIRDGTVIWALKAVQIQEQGSETPVEFDALSYTWGDLGHTFPLECNAAELRIHQNLKNALPYLARRRSSLPLWIDAICINQSDDAEKFVQISMMHSIYRQATQVWVWLGYDIDYGEEAISLLPKVGAVGKEVRGQTWRMGRPSPVDKGLPAFSSPQWGAVTKIIDNKWFSRLWIVQEAALARSIRVLYGDVEIPWDVLHDAVQHGQYLPHKLRNANDYKPPDLTDGTEMVFDIRRITQRLEDRQKAPIEMAKLLIVTATNHHCYDPRDRVFGILGFFSKQDLQSAEISGDLDVEELYARLTRFLFTNIRPSAVNWWTIFNFAWSSEKKREGLPSWCPDYHNLNDTPSYPRVSLLALERHSSGAKKPYDASRGRRVPALPANPRAISVCGKIFDTVKTLLPESSDATKWDTFRSFEERRQGLIRFQAWEKSLAKAVLGDKVDNLPDDPATICTEEDEGRVRFTLDGFWRSLVGNVTEDKRNGGYVLTYETYRTFKVNFARWVVLQEIWDTYDAGNVDLLKECAFGGPADPALMQLVDEIEELIGPDTPFMWFMADALGFLGGRKPFITSIGRFGFGPLRLQEGDKVCVLDFSKTPHVLRCSDRDVPNYQVVGQAYVHDMMYGEVETLGIEEQDIVLV